MRPIILILIGLALGCLICPVHSASAQAPAPSGTVITIAGNGVGGFSGDGGPALDASISGPYGSAIGPNGTLYFADSDNYRIRAVDPATGIITTVAGIGPPPGALEDGPNGDGGPATSAQIGDVHSIAIDRQRNTLYLAPFSLSRIRQLDLATGVIENFAGIGMFDNELGFQDGDGGPATSAYILFPWGVAVGLGSDVLITDYYRLRNVDDATGIIDSVAGVEDAQGFPVHMFGGDGGPASAASFNFPYNLTVDSAGDVYVIDLGVSGGEPENSARVRRIDSATGIIDTIAGGGTMTPGSGLATDMNLTYVVDMAVDDAAGLMYLAVLNQVFQMDLATGQLSLFAGLGAAGFSGDGGPALDAEFNNINGLEVVPGGGLLVSDTDNARIRYIAPNSVHLSGDSGQTDFYLPWVSALSGDLIITNNPNLSVINADALGIVSGGLDISGNILVGELNLPSLVSVGELTISGNTSATVINADALGIVSGSLDISGNILVGELNLPSLVSVGELTISGNTSATVINADALGIVSGSLDISGNILVGELNLPSLVSVGELTIRGNTSATVIDVSSLLSTSGNLDITDNTSATSVHINSLTSADGNVAISGNTSATVVDVGGLVSSGGAVSANGNTSATIVDFSSLVSANGDVTVEDNTSATSVHINSLMSAGGDVAINGNSAATTIDLSSLGSVGGDISITENMSATAIDLSSLVSMSGNIDISANSSAGLIDLSILASVGLISITENMSATTIDLGSLGSVGGDIEISGNASATAIDLSSLVSTSGAIEISGNTAAGVIDLPGLVTAGGDVSITDNTSATIIDLSSLVSTSGDIEITDNTSATSVHISSLSSAGGAVSLNDNTSATSIDLGSLQSATEVTITGNGNAAVSLGSLESVTGSVKLESTGTGTFALGDADVAGETNLSLDGYTTVGASTAGGATAVTMLNSAATMEVTLPDGAFSSANPVTFSIERLPAGDVETVGGEMVTHLETYAFDFAIPTLNSAAELNFEINLLKLDEPDRLSLLNLLHESAELTLSVRGDAPGAELQLFDVCSAGPVVDACVVVQWLDELRMVLDPLVGVDPSILRFEALVGHFSTYSVVAVGLAGDYNVDGTVDAADYVVWRKTDGTQEGYDIWRANFGRTAGAQSISDVVVPEPANWMLLIFAATLFGWKWRQRSRVHYYSVVR